MRLEPIEKPRGLLNRVAYWMSRRELGKVPSVISVVYARSRPLAMLGYRMRQFTEKGVKLDPSLRLLIQIAVAEANGCGFCVDIGRAIAVEKGIGLDKFNAIAEYETSPLFDDRERAALTYARAAGGGARVPNETFERLRKHFDEREIIDVTAMIAVERFYNGIAIPLGLEADGLCAIQLDRKGIAAA
jgi:AhpD family alkylhydroperoxidase